MTTSKLMSTVETTTTQEMALPDHALNRSIVSSSLCIRSLYASTGALVAQGPVRIDTRQIVSPLDLRPRVVGRLVRDAEVDRVGPGEDLFGPGPLRLQDRHEVRVVLRFRGDDRVPGLQLVVAHGLRRLDELDAAREQLPVVV